MRRSARSLLVIGCVLFFCAMAIEPVKRVGANTATGTYAGGLNTYSLTASQAASLSPGLTYLRTDVNVSESSVQNIYSLANSAGIKIIGILDEVMFKDPSSFTLADWTNAVSNAAHTYPAITVWEIWNEPQNGQFNYGYEDGTPQHYFNMLQAAYQTLKAINPNSIVIALGGPQLGNAQQWSWTQQVWSLGGANYCDAISVHAYPFNLYIGENWAYYQSLWTSGLAQYQTLGKPIWLTETGLQSNQENQTDQAVYLNESYNFFKQQGVSVYDWYELKDYTAEPSLYWGLLNADGSAKTAYATYLNLLQTTTSPTTTFTTLTAVTSTTFATSSTSTTSSIQTPVSSTTTTVSGTSVITNTLLTTTTTTGSAAGTSTTTFTSPLSTSYSTTSSVASSATSVTQTGTTTSSAVQSETTTNTGTTFITTTSGGTVTVSETVTFKVLLTQLIQQLKQFEAFVLQTLGFQVTATPVGQQVKQVIVTVTTPTSSTTSSATVTSSRTSTSTAPTTSSTSSTQTISTTTTSTPTTTATTSSSTTSTKTTSTPTTTVTTTVTTSTPTPTTTTTTTTTTAFSSTQTSTSGSTLTTGSTQTTTQGVVVPAHTMVVITPTTTVAYTSVASQSITVTSSNSSSQAVEPGTEESPSYALLSLLAPLFCLEGLMLNPISRSTKIGSKLRRFIP